MIIQPSTPSLPIPRSRRRRARLAHAFDAVGVLERLFWLRAKLRYPVLTVLAYHRVATEREVGDLDPDVIDAYPEELARQVASLRGLCTFVTSTDLLAHLRGRPLPPNPVMLSFDDGYMDNFSVALPLLRAAGARATFFVPTAFPDGGKLFWWDRVSVLMRRCRRERVVLTYPRPAVLHPQRDPGGASEAVGRMLKNDPGLDLERLMDELERATGVTLGADEERALAARTIMGFKEVRALRDAGMDVQSHSHGHRVLDTLTPEDARADLARSRAILSDVLGERVCAVAYPVGYPLRGSYQFIAREAGFELGFTNSSGLCRLDALDALSVPRVAMDLGHVGPLYKLVVLMGEKPHRMHDVSLRNLTGEARPSTSTSTSPPVTALVTELAELERLAPEWESLALRSESDSPTVTPEWSLAWWRVFGPLGGRRLQVLTVRRDGRLIGLAPLLSRVHWHSPGIPFRRLELIASGEDEKDEILSEYLGLIAERGAEATVADRFAGALCGGAMGRWDELVLPLMDGSTTMPDRLRLALRGRGLFVEVLTRSDAPYIELPPTWEAYLASLSSSRRYVVTRSLRDFEKWAAGAWSFERATTPAGLARGAEVLRSLHGERWGDEREGGLFGSPRFEGFHRSVMPRLLERGALELSWLTVRGEPIAAAYSLCHRGKIHFYQGGRRVDLPKGIRPGIVLHAMAIRRAIEAGLREYDFLGGATQYKQQLATCSRPLVDLRAVRSRALDTLRGLAGRGMAGAKELLRRRVGGRPPIAGTAAPPADPR